MKPLTMLATLLLITAVNAAPAMPRAAHELVYRIEFGDLAGNKRPAMAEQIRADVIQRLKIFGMEKTEVVLLEEGRLAIRWKTGLIVGRKDWGERIQAEMSAPASGIEFRIVVVSQPLGISREAETARLKKHLRELEGKGEAWTADSVDLSPFDVKKDDVVYRWFPYTRKAIVEDEHEDFPFVLLELNPAEEFTASDIERTYPTTDNAGRPAVGFTLKSDRGAAFGDFTGSHVNRQLAIVLDGEVSTTPRLNDRITAQGVIYGGAQGFTTEETRNLRDLLRRNPIPLPLTLVDPPSRPAVSK